MKGFMCSYEAAYFHFSFSVSLAEMRPELTLAPSFFSAPQAI
jgi:hypothetical protein